MTKWHYHTHRCPDCGEQWICSNKYCQGLDELCAQCDVMLFETWAEERGYLNGEDAEESTEGAVC